MAKVCQSSTRLTPSALSDREKELYEELAKLASFNPRGHFG